VTEANIIIAAISVWTFLVLMLGIHIGKAERESIAAGEPTETGVTGR
jgi:hypothetical protein